MNPFPISILMFPAIVIFIVTLFFCYKFTRYPATSMTLAFIKSSIFVIYFGVLFDGTYTFLDDWSYLEGGRRLLQEGIGLFNLHKNFDLVTSIGRGRHIVYYSYNADALRLFDDGYYAPVALNVLLTVAIAFLGAKLAYKAFDLKKRDASVFFIFLLFHPDILAWSNVMNGKDILVLLCHVLLLWSVYYYYQSRFLICLVLAIPTAFVLFFLRFYIPLIFVVPLVINSVLNGGRNRGKLITLSLLTITAILYWMGFGQIYYAVNVIESNFVNPLYGFVRMLLTPIPFNTDKAYAFLNIPALFLFAFFPFLIIGIFSLFTTNRMFSKYFIYYFLCFICLYSIFSELQGPRHRVQLDFAIAVFQFIGIRKFLLETIGSRMRQTQNV